jgi:hypothetical protein
MKIIAPKDGEVIHRSSVEVKLDLKGGHLAVPATTGVQPDEAHLHITIDVLPIRMTASLNQQVPNVRPGRHLLTVEFEAGNHLPFEPRLLANVGFKLAR